MIGCLVSVGCSRGYYRQSADGETYPIVRERQVDPAYAIGRERVEPAPFSRLTDPTPPDAPPKPPDDTAASVFMANPGGLKGAKNWEKDGVSTSIEPVGWEEYLPRNSNGNVRLTAETSTTIALANSREYQSRLEAVYLAALGLTLNRFEFATRYFLTLGSLFTHQGASSLPAESNTLTANTRFGFNRNFAAGGQLLVDFANAFVWEFTGKTHSANGTIAMSFVQPLLRGFGRKVRLENLTQAERDVLYAVRDYARFRKIFWAGVNVDSGGYLQLLRQVQTVRNAKANLVSQEENYALYRKLFQGGRTQVVNVDQVYQSLLSARRDVISSEIDLQNQLDGFKLRLGLPPRLPVELDDSPLDRFKFTSEATDKLREEIDKFDRSRKAELGNYPTVQKSQEHLKTVGEFLDRADQAVERVTDALTAWEKDLNRKPSTDEDKEQQERAAEAYKTLKDDPAELKAQLKTLRTKLKEHQPGTDPEKEWNYVLDRLKDVAVVIDAVLAAEGQARIYTVHLPDIDITEADGLQFAREHRLDLMNAQAQVTDAWRKVTVAANGLLSDFNVRFDAALNSDPASKNPLDFSNDASRYALGFQFDGPLNRQAERNAYRASLIAYQQARRNYMAVSDQVEFEIRVGLRSLRQQRINFEIARQQVLVATRQLTIERRNLTAPVAAEARGRDDAGATLRILQAQSQLLAARNGLADNFFGYEQQRIRLLINLEKLLLDAEGFPTNDSSEPTPDRTEPTADDRPVGQTRPEVGRPEPKKP